MSAIREATRLRRAIENDLREQLKDFTAKTGLLVKSVEVRPIETTNLDSEFRVFGDYQVDVEVTIE